MVLVPIVTDIVFLWNTETIITHSASEHSVIIANNNV